MLKVALLMCGLTLALVLPASGQDPAAAAADSVRVLLDGSLSAPAAVRSAYREDDSRSLPDRLDDYEREVIQAALDHAAGNVAEVARQLQTDRANLYRRMRRLGIDR